MKNVDLFNEFVLRVFNKLYENFPVAVPLRPHEFVSDAPYLSEPYYEPNTYMGPDMWETWGDDITVEELLNNHDWSEAIEKTEELIGRCLTDIEHQKLVKTGHRPVTESEVLRIDEHTKQLIEFRELEALNKKEHDEVARKREIFSSTVKFLHNEGLIRYHDIPVPFENSSRMHPPDVVISRRSSDLKFVLTSKGFTHLNRRLERGKVKKNITLYEAIKKSLGESGIQGGTAFAAQTLVAWAIS